MLSLYRTLSLRYLSRRWFGALLIVSCIMLGVALLVATQALNDTMSKAALASSNPLAGTVDLIVTNGQLPLDRALAKEISGVPGVKAVHPRIFDQAKLLIGDEKRPVLVLGIELTNDDKEFAEFAEQFILDPMIKKFIEDSKKAEMVETPPQKMDIERLKEYFDSDIVGNTPAILGEELSKLLESQPEDWVSRITGLKVFQIEKGLKKHTLVRVATLKPKADSDLAALGGHVVILGLDNAAKVLGLAEGKVRRLDVALYPGIEPRKVRKALEDVLKDRAEVRTLEEQNQALQSAMTGMKTGFSMCGLAALVVGMFLVYNVLSVAVAERRHEIGILLSLGARRDQIWRLFAGEAFLLGCLGSALGIPLGLGLAYLSLQPMQEAVSDVFSLLNLRQVELSWQVVVLAFVVGTLSAVVASLVPTVKAAQDKPVDAVRHIPKEPALSHLIFHIAVTIALIFIGMSMILVREYLPYKRWGTYGGLGLVMIGTLMTAPLFAHVAARLLAPLSRRFFPIAWRLAADNLVRTPGRTGLVIGVLAAGVCLVVETAGIIRSNRLAIHDWVDSSIAADLVVTSGSPVGSGGQPTLMTLSLRDELLKFPEVEDALPIQFSTKVLFRESTIAIMTNMGDRAYAVEKGRVSKHQDIELVKRMDEEENAVIISENFAALHHVRTGDYVPLKSPHGEVKLHVIGTVVDYSWNLGTILMNRRDYVKHWQDESVTLFDVYLRSRDRDKAREVKQKIATQLGAQHDLHPLTREELQAHIDGMIERLYGVAYAQQIVIMMVVALGMVTALLISVLQRRREMGLLRAIGASRGQVVYLVLSEAFLMGLIGTILGALFSIPLQWYALQVVFLEESGYYFPVYIPWSEAGLIALLAMGIATLAGLGPALYAVRQRIPEAIAYE